MLYPTVKVFRSRRRYRILWLKYIVGFDLGNHCKKTFVGGDSKAFKGWMNHLENFELDEYEANYYYLCGVEENFTYEKNFHLAFVYAPGSVLKVDDGVNIVEIEDARKIPIYADQNGYDKEPLHNKDPKYTTCRNWQFGYQIVYGTENYKKLY